jgi:hypothetical protein
MIRRSANKKRVMATNTRKKEGNKLASAPQSKTTKRPYIPPDFEMYKLVIDTKHLLGLP